MMHMTLRFVCTFVLLPFGTMAGDITGKIVSVTDRDTIKVLDGKQERKVRLIGIDAPERGQPFSDRAKRTLSGLVFGKTARVTWKTHDKYDRIFVDVYIGGAWINRDMVERGMAWAYDPSTTKQLRQAEAQARNSRLGLWTDKAPVPPWEFRKRKRRDQGPFENRRRSSSWIRMGRIVS